MWMWHVACGCGMWHVHVNVHVHVACACGHARRARSISHARGDERRARQRAQNARRVAGCTPLCGFAQASRSAPLASARCAR
eukprot:2941354-Prymnesium_polylepis.1